MSLKSLATSVTALQARTEQIEMRISRVDSALQALAAALAATPIKGRSTEPAKTSKRAARKTHQWFAQGEARALMKKLIKKPAAPSEIVKALAHAKGYDATLASEQLKRFHATAYMAVSNAVKTGAARKDRQGLVRIV